MPIDDEEYLSTCFAVKKSGNSVVGINVIH